MKRILEYLLSKNIKLKEFEIEQHENDLFSPKHQKNTYGEFIAWFWKAIRYYGDFTEDEADYLKKYLCFYVGGRIMLDSPDHYINYAENDFVEKELTFKEGYDLVMDFLNKYKKFWKK